MLEPGETYEDFKELVPYEIYQAFPAPYFKIAMAKGLLTYDDLIDWIEYYSVQLGI